MDFAAGLPIFVITLREALEASLVVGIVLACLAQAQQLYLKGWVYRGISAGVVASVLVGCLLAGVLQGVDRLPGPYTPILKALLAALLGAIAVGMLSWMLLWMTKQARSIRGEIQGQIDQALAEEGGGRAIAVVVFIAVVREGFEMVLFLAAQQNMANPAAIGAALAGIATAVAMALLIFRVGVKLNLKLFFQVMGTLLLIIVGGLVIGVLKNLDLAVNMMGLTNLGLDYLCFVPGDSCLLGPQLWNLASWLPDNQFPGIVLKTLAGYRDHLYLLQAIAYGIFLSVMGSLYFRGLTDKGDSPKAMAQKS
ncbi:EfeU/Ftr1 family ferrous iron transporter subunit [Synechocystis salina]|uniref:FTR1 family protein n=1 Tax=Synechocystis salina LEGE 00031 TaxID=1828736 RepID=A0ABR9VVL5_9SYNC|nr:FTR1 family protein [Synechocystis salina]MBE9241945.1 FTR1 family protein [Synechocystis salina LEGE 00041]MBE9255394.1 FTR1 family protein [Synechocystis salina LEGE 00031]